MVVFNIIVSVLPAISIVFAAVNGRLGELTAAALEGAGAAISLCFGLAGVICFWQAILELMSRSGIMYGLSRLLRPALGKLFPSALNDRDTLGALSANVSANLLGLGNAATPAGIKAAKGLQRLSDSSAASAELCLLVVMNSASLQLVPTTVAALRSSLGAAAAFDILPAVWLTSAVSVSAGLLAARLFEARS